MHVLDRSQQGLNFFLQRIGITVVARVERTLVGIHEDVGLSAAKLVAGTAVGLQRPDIFSYKLLHLSVIAFLCASSPSASAIASTAGPMERMPSGVSFWKVTFLIYESRFTPL